LVPIFNANTSVDGLSGVAVSGGSILVPASMGVNIAPVAVGNLSVVPMDGGVGDIASVIGAMARPGSGLPRVMVAGGGISLTPAPTPTSSTANEQ
jgi:hypothetical protein